jgi:hypothetical protein
MRRVLHVVLVLVLVLQSVSGNGFCFVDAEDVDFEELVAETKQLVINVTYQAQLDTEGDPVYYFGNSANLTDCIEVGVENRTVVLRVNSMDMMQKLGSRVNVTLFSNYLHLATLMGTVRNNSLWHVYCENYLSSASYAHTYVKQLEIIRDATVGNSSIASLFGSYVTSPDFSLAILCYGMNITNSMREYMGYNEDPRNATIYHPEYLNSPIVQLSNYKSITYDIPLEDSYSGPDPVSTSNMYGDTAVVDSLVGRSYLGSGALSSFLKTVGRINDRPDPENPRLRRAHFVYDILFGAARVFFSGELISRFFNNVTTEISQYVSDRIREDADGIGYLYNRAHVLFMHSLETTAGWMETNTGGETLLDALRFVRDISVRDLKLVLTHESAFLSYKDMAQVAFNVKRQRQMSFQYERRAAQLVYTNGTHKTIPRHVLHWSLLSSSDNQPNQPARWPFTEYFTVAFWRDERGWNGTGIYDRSVLRPWHPKDWYRWLLSWIRYFFRIDPPAPPCNPSPGYVQDMNKGCHVTTFAYLPPLWSSSFFPTWDMCSEWNTAWSVYKGTIQYFGTAYFSGFLQRHPGYKPYLSWIVRHDNPNDPAQPYVGDNVLPCLVAKAGAWLLLISVVDGSVLALIVLLIVFDEPIAELSRALDEGNQAYYNSVRKRIKNILQRLYEEEIHDQGPFYQDALIDANDATL